MSHNKVRNPHFAIPMRLAGGRMAVVDQDSEAEIFQSAVSALRYELGQRYTLPEYGRNDQALRMNGADLTHLRSVVERWEPRATADVFTDDDLADAIQEVNVELRLANG